MPQGEEAFGVCLIREGDESGDPNVIPHEVGTTAEIGDVTPLENGKYYINTVGRRRFRIDQVISREPYITVDATYKSEDPPQDPAAHALSDRAVAAPARPKRFGRCEMPSEFAIPVRCELGFACGDLGFQRLF